MDLPDVSEKGLGFEFSWHNNGTSTAAIELQKMRWYGDSLSALVTAKCYLAGYKPIIARRSLNLLATRTLQAFIQELSKRCPEVEWEIMLEQVINLTLEKMSRQEMVTITSEDSIEKPSYLIYPFVAKGMPTIIYGPAGGGKSYLGLMLALITHLGETGSKLRVKVQHCNTLYMDYEDTREDIAYRTKCLTRGMDWKYMEIPYIRGISPLAECVEQVKQIVDENNIGFIVIDSLGPAAGAKLNDAETAITFFNALRKLNVSTLIIAHIPKNADKEKTIFGSSYFQNLARSVWELKSSNGENTIDIGLYHRKSNIGKLFPTQGFTFTFNDESITASYTDVKDIPELEEYLSLPVRIQNLLRSQPMTLDELLTTLEVDKDTLKNALYRMHKRNQIRQLERGTWALVDQGGLL